METSIILNIIFISLVSIGFICYQIWIGSRLVRLNNRLKQSDDNMSNLDIHYNQKISEVENSLNQQISITEVSIMEEVRNNTKLIDRIDSRLDEKIKNIYSDLTEKNK